MEQDKNSDPRRQIIHIKMDPRAQAANVRFWFIVDLLIAFMVAAFWATILFWAARYTGLLRPLKPSLFQTIVGVSAVLLVGIAAFSLRLWLRRAYGIAEVLFALVVAWNALSSRNQLSTFQALIALASAVYLVVRGLDNWLQGVETRHGTRLRSIQAAERQSRSPSVTRPSKAES
jgi:hypothetical protein